MNDNFLAGQTYKPPISKHGDNNMPLSVQNPVDPNRANVGRADFLRMNSIIEPQKLDFVTYTKLSGDSQEGKTQEHMQSSLVRDSFYQKASGQRSWEVAEINMTRVPRDQTEGSVKEACKYHDCQIVRVTLDMDPINGMCKGRGKVVLRYNPDNNGLEKLLQKFQQNGWVCQIENPDKEPEKKRSSLTGDLLPF